jgi:hypothetical protein
LKTTRWVERWRQSIIETTNVMNLEMRRKLARLSYPEKIRKVEELIRLVRSFPKAKRKGQVRTDTVRQEPTRGV